MTEATIDIPSTEPRVTPAAKDQWESEAPPVMLIRRSGRWVSINFRDLWHYRELLYFLIWRDIKVRYKQTVVGAAWAILQPFLTMVVFSVVFGRIAGMSSEGIPYPIFLYTGLLPWLLFSNSMTQSANSLVANQTLITKVYFPRLIVPTASVLSGLVDFGIASLVLFGMMFYYGVAPTAAVWTIPLFVLLAIASALTAGLWLSALNVRYRDVRHAIPFLTQLWLFASPVLYPGSEIIQRFPENWRALYGLNPMVGVVEGFRWALLGKPDGLRSEVFVSVLVVLVLLVGGVVYFRRMEQTIADVV